jgi:hypothetical protein
LRLTHFQICNLKSSICNFLQRDIHLQRFHHAIERALGCVALLLHALLVFRNARYLVSYQGQLSVVGGQ